MHYYLDYALYKLLYAAYIIFCIILYIIFCIILYIHVISGPGYTETSVVVLPVGRDVAQ